MTTMKEIKKAFLNSYLFKGKTATRVSDSKAKRLSESLVVPDGSKQDKNKKDGAYLSGERTWGDGSAIWYEMVPPLVHRRVDGYTETFEYILVSRVDGMTRAYGACGDGRVWSPNENELYSEKGEIDCETIMKTLGYKMRGDNETVTKTKEEGAESVESYEEYEDEKYGNEDEESETPEGETGTPEPHETKTPEAEETGSPEPEEDDD